jgi:hypothetical protein
LGHEKDSRNDWEIKAPVWFNRLQNNGFLVHDKEDIFVDD